MRILVIDDDPYARRLLAQQLTRLGVDDVDAVDSGPAALSMLASATAGFDALFIDLNMPGMDGVEFLRHLAQQRFRGGLVLISGEDERILQSVARLALAHRLRVAGTLHKPFSPRQLENALAGLPLAARTTIMPTSRRPYRADELREAIAAGQLINHYQPQVRLASGDAEGVEALVRWQHPSDGLVLPAEFVPLAERNGLSHELAGAVLAGALRAARRWRDAGLDLRLSVNVAMDNLVELDFPEEVSSAALSAGVPVDRLVLEVTESQVTRDRLKMLDIATRLRQRVGLSIDDFGTGFSSLVQLRDVPFDELKLDRSFVHGVGADPQLQAILAANLEMARQLGLRTVAEGVERRDDWDRLQAMGCDCAQGYLIARPMPEAALRGWIADWQMRRHELFEPA